MCININNIYISIYIYIRVCTVQVFWCCVCVCVYFYRLVDRTVYRLLYTKFYQHVHRHFHQHVHGQFHRNVQQTMPTEMPTEIPLQRSRQCSWTENSTLLSLLVQPNANSMNARNLYQKIANTQHGKLTEMRPNAPDIAKGHLECTVNTQPFETVSQQENQNISVLPHVALRLNPTKMTQPIFQLQSRFVLQTPNASRQIKIWLAIDVCTLFTQEKKDDHLDCTTNNIPNKYHTSPLSSQVDRSNRFSDWFQNGSSMSNVPTKLIKPHPNTESEHTASHQMISYFIIDARDNLSKLQSLQDVFEDWRSIHWRYKSMTWESN